jgi:N-acetylglucosaminyldiphosphoundecaprenol N-acetyl-beta-D-mannosaminyltransferase
MSPTATWPDRVPIVGTPISVTSYAELLELLDRRPSDRAATIAFCNVHSVMTARRQPEVAAALTQADVATSDGMPLVWGLRAFGHPDQPRVYGPAFMEIALRESVEAEWSHFFYGSTDETLTKLVGAAEKLAPGVRIAGSYSPPFRPANDDDLRADAARIRESGADLVWVGLGMPKQELWMDRAAAHLPGTALLGVGAAFDFLAGTVSQAPMWMQSSGLEWLYRFAQEPGRLWRRYIINNPSYLLLLGRDLLWAQIRRKR